MCNPVDVYGCGDCAERAAELQAVKELRRHVEAEERRRGRPLV